MQCHVIILGTTDTTYTLYRIEKRKETIKEKTEKQRRETESKKDKKIWKEKLEETICRGPPPAGQVANTYLKKNELEIMQCHIIIILIDTTGTTYTLYEIEKQKETIKDKTKGQMPKSGIPDPFVPKSVTY